MPVPFRDAEEVAELGSAGFLRFIHDLDGNALSGGVLLVDARAEPLELAHHWMALPGGTLWSAKEACRHTGRRLAVELFRALGRTPGLLLVRDDDGAVESWLRDLEISIPVGFLEGVREGGAVTARWPGGGPVSLSPPGRLFERLAGRDLLREPFERVTRALREFHPYVVGGSGE
ncbi:MAG: hypothetical protein M3418_04990 [Gemmatimonadota bacterium]|nr:hypothetical protein [Gemmatimonadota bacterium]